MIKIFLELITRNFIALSYLKAENINKKLLNEKIINFKIGKEADFTVLDPESTPLMSYRMQNCKSLEERLAVIVLLGDDRAILATYANGHCVHDRDIDEES